MVPIKPVLNIRVCNWGKTWGHHNNGRLQRRSAEVRSWRRENQTDLCDFGMRDPPAFPEVAILSETA